MIEYIITVLSDANSPDDVVKELEEFLGQRHTQRERERERDRARERERVAERVRNRETYVETTQQRYSNCRDRHIIQRTR